MITSLAKANNNNSSSNKSMNNKSGYNPKQSINNINENTEIIEFTNKFVEAFHRSKTPKDF